MGEKTFIIYKHTSPKGKVYIGMTCNKPVVRWGKNGSGYKNNTHFWSAIQKYGWDNFEHEILLYGLSKKQAEEKEKEFIKLYQSTNKTKGYNICSGGEVNVPTDETKKKISDANRGRKWTEEQKARISGRDKGRFVPIEWREKMSASHKGIKHSEETKRKISQSNKGKVFTEEHRKNISKSCKGRTVKEETKKKISETLLKSNRKISEKHKEKLIKIKSKPIICLDTNVVYDSAKQASEILKIPRTSISANINKRSKHAGGFRFEFYE